MSFILQALLFLVLAQFAPEAAAYVVVVHHSGISDTTRIIIIIVSIVLVLLIIACRVMRIRQQRAAIRNAAILPVTAQVQQPQQIHQPNFASQGPGGYNGYTIPHPPQGQYPPPQNNQGQGIYGPPSSQGPGGYNGYTIPLPPQGQYPPPQNNQGQGNYGSPSYGPGMPTLSMEKVHSEEMTPPVTAVIAPGQQYPSYFPPNGSPPAHGAPVGYTPPVEAPHPPYLIGHTPLSPVPVAHTTGQDHAHPAGFSAQ
ncbi:hypothetical protein C8J57DRAFT_1275064 [Mycena rebaudengoi]|nr:hypothetical protein C8J57DRAFT_1275064 [Mycena rebaudengoi]